MNHNGTNSANLKYNNRQLILNIIRRQRVSRAELARITGLTRAAVTLLVDGMIREGLVLETGAAEASYGRKPVLLGLNPESFYAVGVYISRDFCTVGIVDILGNPVETDTIPIHVYDSAQACIRDISGKIARLLKRKDIPEEKLLGIGVSTPGPVDIHRGVILNPPNFDLWHQVRIVEELEKDFPVKILLDNNSTSLALAENSYGRGAEFHSFMLLVVNDGIGAGLIINDRLYRGVGGFGNEVGHTSVNIDGETCSCGNRGCLELYASVPAVLKAAGKKGKQVSAWSEIVDGALKGDPVCIWAVEEEARYLATGIVNVINTLELEAVVLAGDVSYKPDLLLEKVAANAGKMAINRDINKLRIYSSSILKDAGIISAAAVVIEEFFHS